MARGVGGRHDAQVADLADAAVRVVERGGLPALTFRNVAAEAEVSPGRVQHYFRSSRGLAAAVFRRVRTRAGQRIERQLTSTGAAGSGRAVVTATLHALVPAGDRQATELRVAHLVELHAMTDAELREELRSGRAELMTFLTSQLTLARDAGEASSDVEPERAAVILLAAAEGLSGMALLGPLTGDEARARLDDVLGQVLGPWTPPAAR